LNAHALWALVAIVLVAGGGWPYARLAGLRGPLFLAGCWLFGCGIAVLSMVLLSAAQVTYSRAALAAAWALLVATGAILCRRTSEPAENRLPDIAGPPWFPPNLIAGRRSLRPPRACGQSWLSDAFCVFSIAVCVFQVVYVFLQAVRVPLGSFDSWALWEYKGRHFWLDRTISPQFLTDHSAIFAHPAYPPAIPLLIAWVYTWVGAADPAVMKPIFPVFYAALLLALAGGVHERLGRRAACFAAACLALVPRIADYAGTGLADVPLAACVTAAIAAFVAAERAPQSWRLYAGSGALLGLAANIKHDALVYVAAAVLLLALSHALRRHAAAIIAAFVLAVPWYVFAVAIRAPDRDFMPVSIAGFGAHADRLTEIVRLFVLNALSTAEWNVLWYAVAVLAARGLILRALQAPALLMLVVVPLACFACGLVLSAWPDYQLHVRTSVDRLILVTAPLALWFAIEQLLAPRLIAAGPRHTLDEP
jgi:hypothetical protein